MNSDDDPEVLQTVLRAAALEETESYLVRGRRFERLSKEDLSERWIAGFKACCRDRTLELQREFDDAAAELMLRGEEPPFDAVRDETAALADAAARDLNPRRRQQSTVESTDQGTVDAGSRTPDAIESRREITPVDGARPRARPGRNRALFVGPIAKGQIGGVDDGSALVEPADQMKQQLVAGLSEGQVAEFVALPAP